MRVVVFGRKRTIQRLTVFLASEGIELVVISDGIGESVALEEPGSCDLAIVDSLSEEAEAVCHHIREFWEIPLVLTVGQKQADWERLQSLGADGYLPREARAIELAARLRAILRRFCPAGPAGNSAPHP